VYACMYLLYYYGGCTHCRHLWLHRKERVMIFLPVLHILCNVISVFLLGCRASVLLPKIYLFVQYIMSSKVLLGKLPRDMSGYGIHGRLDTYASKTMHVSIHVYGDVHGRYICTTSGCMCIETCMIDTCVPNPMHVSIHMHRDVYRYENKVSLNLCQCSKKKQNAGYKATKRTEICVANGGPTSRL
jgi:hypothetical protein